MPIVDKDNYYKTATGQGTSGQYYVNPLGVRASVACTWGTKENAWGNWAPAIFGIGWNTAGNEGFFSLTSNAPTQVTATLGYRVSIEGANIPCRYEGDTIHWGAGNSASVHSANQAGCTVSVKPGDTVTYHLTP